MQELELKQKRDEAIWIALKRTGLIKPRYEAMIKMRLTPKPFQSKMHQACQEYLKSPDKNLLITGPSGTGKTLFMVRLAATLAKPVELRQNHIEYTIPYVPKRSVRFSTTADLIGLIKKTYERDTFDRGYDEDETIEIFAIKPDNLILDDFDKVNNTEWACDMLWKILDRRSIAMKPTAASSNLSIERLHKKYGEAVASRLADSAILVEIKGPDQRIVK